jgi:subfamily B ATP-binding cassette protein MsbA
MILLGGRAVMSQTLTLGDLTMYTLCTALVAAPLIQVAQVGTQVAEAFGGLDRIREVLAIPTEDFEDRDRARVPPLSGEVRFDRVSFEYAAGAPVLKDISFVAPAGTTTALVGPSGSGKSTLLGLIAAFGRPTGGRILVDGHDLATFRLREFRARLGIVQQENFLFDGTILDNIRFSRPDATMDQVRTVSRIAHCDEFVARFPQGYDTIVGERGVKLSGGQRQRVAIARAILAEPTILLLDEATSSLDSESESLVQEALGRLMQNRTTVIIAHRLSTTKIAHRIAVLDKGSIIELGRHDELMARDGLYAKLYSMQFREDLMTLTNGK